MAAANLQNQEGTDEDMLQNGDIKINNVKVLAEEKCFMLYLSSSGFVMYDDVKSFADKVKNAIQAPAVKFNMSCGASFDDFIAGERGRTMLWHSILEMVKDTHVGSWAILKNAGFMIEGPEIIITAADGVVDILRKQRIDEVVCGYIRQLWDKKVQVV